MESHTRPFRFLDLPTELRVMIYEFLPYQTIHHTLNIPTATTSNPNSKKQDPTQITLVSKGIPVQLLATCKKIRNEAQKYLEPKLSQLKTQTPRIIVDAQDISCLCDNDGILSRLFRYLDHRFNNRTPYAHWSSQTYPNAPQDMEAEAWITKSAFFLLSRMRAQPTTGRYLSADVYLNLSETAIETMFHVRGTLLRDIADVASRDQRGGLVNHVCVAGPRIKQEWKKRGDMPGFSYVFVAVLTYYFPLDLLLRGFEVVPDLDLSGVFSGWEAG